MSRERTRRLRTLQAIVAFIAVTLVLSVGSYFHLKKSTPRSTANELRVLAYSSFTSSWGPGPKLARMFEDEMHSQGVDVGVVLLQAEDAGMLLAKMEAFPADVVIGFDQLGLRLARKARGWKLHGLSGLRHSDGTFFGDDVFFAIDWAPVGFVYRHGEIEPPKDFADLLSERFSGAIALQDPRSSSPGFQLLNWLVQEMGEEKAFEYLRALKPNVHSMSGSWSQAYGIFTRGLAKLTLSYATSIQYHRISEKDDRYRFAVFPVAHPVQVEYAAVPDACQNCDLALKFMKFLSGPAAQAVIMEKNWMFPTNEAAMKGSPFETFLRELETGAGLKVQDLSKAARDPDALLKRWREAVL